MNAFGLKELNAVLQRYVLFKLKWKIIIIHNNINKYIEIFVSTIMV